MDSSWRPVVSGYDSPCLGACVVAALNGLQRTISSGQEDAQLPGAWRLVGRAAVVLLSRFPPSNPILVVLGWVTGCVYSASPISASWVPYLA